jgi:hypothetical protein
MSIIGSVNGWPLLALPLTPGQRQVDWSMVNIVGAVPNPYTGRQQTMNWQAGYWEAVVTMPPMSRIQAGAWIAFMAQAQGMNAVFYFGDGLGTMPQGLAQGAGVTAGSFQAPFQLTTKNWTPNQLFTLLSPGDWIQIGYRLYQCMDQVSSDGAGNASFAIWPQIREIPANGTAIVTTNAQGLFRMKSNVLKYSVSYLRTYGLSFEIREAI